MDNEELYKQLKRLEFELKVTKADYEASEQENKELKELKCKFKEYCTCDTELYRSALEEIRILATKNVSIENFVKIQNKINEVLQ